MLNNVTICPGYITFILTIPQILSPNHLRSGLAQLASLSQPGQIVQVQRRVVQLSDQMAFDIRPRVSVQNWSQLIALVLRVLPLQKGGRSVRRRGLEYVRFDVWMHAPGLPFPTKLAYDLVCVPHMASFHLHHSPNSENRGSDEV